MGCGPGATRRAGEMMTPSDQRFVLREGAAIWQEVDGETILLTPATSQYMGINEAGTTLWPALIEGAAHHELVTLLRDRYGLSEVTASRDVDTFVSECRRLGFLQP